MLLIAIATTSAAIVGYYPMDEGSGTTVKDASGKGHDAAIVGAVSWAQSKPYFGTALDFSGTAGNYVSAGTWNPSESTGQLSLATWIKWAGATGAYQGIVGKADGTGTSACWQLTINSAATSEIGFAGGFPNWLASAPPVDQWEHVAVTFDGATITMYINGASTGTATGTLGAATSATVTIGARTLTSAGDAAFKGTMDEVYIFDKALSAAEVGQVMQGAFANPYKSREPNPANLATDVFRDTALGWTAGKDAVSHDVYLGTNATDVQSATKADSKGVLAAAGQADSTYDPPGHLELGQTYYWRVDEVNDAGPAKPTKGDVWSFTVEPIAYKVTDITATASSAAAASPVVNTINESGLTGDLHGSYPETMWLTASGGIPAWIQFDFDQVYKMYEMWIWNQNSMFETILGLGAKDTVIEYSADGTNWTSLGDFELAQATGEDTIAPTSTIAFNGLSVKSVRVTINSNWGNPIQVGLSEVRFLYTPVMARDPKPATGSTDIDPTTVVFSWRPGREAASHNIYTGTDPNALTLSGTSMTNSFSPSNLSVSTKCYWRVDEVNAAMTPTTWPSKVWDFTTADFVVVDDMESYNDTDNKIFDTWADGYNTTTNGSQVGYGESANGTFGETTTVHGGKQSMPFGYGNDGITTSEATRTFGTAQDWTAAGVKTLVLFFYGDPTNSAVQLYAKINGKELVYGGAAGNIQRSGWNQWNIDLSSVSGGVKAVKTLTIGVRGSGTGMLFIDDIRLYKNAP
jgi:hypothetical protein